jgi:hypothetical protein
MYLPAGLEARVLESRAGMLVLFWNVREGSVCLLALPTSRDRLHFLAGSPSSLCRARVLHPQTSLSDSNLPLAHT